MVDIIWKKPSKCSKNELDEFEALVIKGGEVAAKGLRGRINQHGEWLVFLFENDKTLAGVAALKRPKTNYRKKVFKKAESQEDPNEFTFEAGWICVDEQFRGRKYSHSLLKTVLNLAGDKCLYVTTREKNDRMRSTNIHFGLKLSGHPYASEEGDYKLVLYTRHSP